MRRRITAILYAALLAVLSCVTGCVQGAETEPEWTDPFYLDDEDAKYVSVSFYLPDSYGKRNVDWEVVRLPQFYLDPLREKTTPREMSSDHSFTIKLSTEARDLYIIPPGIARIEEIEEQLISMDQDAPIETELFTVEAVYIPELIGGEPLKNVKLEEKGVVVCARLFSAAEQYPYAMSLQYDGKSYPRRSVYTETLDVVEPSIQYRRFDWVLPDLYTAAMAVKYGTLSYKKLWSVETAEDVVFVCDDETVKIHLLGAAYESD
ncbi:MAG: hypothetical protein IJL53_08675 [Firmicutes bacterium]|nr:hypothetical protein [Bacillota bacterium]